MRDPIRWAGAILLGVVVVAGITWAVASQTLRSPAELAADTAAPEPGPVTVPVEERVLEAEVIVRGTVQFDEPIEIELGGQPTVDGQAVITRVPAPDDDVAAGDVLLEVSGRPLLALEGELPAYRDLRPGMSGDDVTQLQRALQALGHLQQGTDGQFGPATQRAVEALYEEAGHEPAGASSEDEERLRAARERVSAAREQVRQAEQRLEEAQQGPGEVERLEAEHQVEQARERVGSAADGAERRQAERELEIAEARRAELQAGAQTDAEEQALADARAELNEAHEQERELEVASGTWLPAAEVAYVADLPQRIHDVAVELGEEAAGPLVTISSPEIVIESSIPAEDAGLVSEGDEVLIDADGRELVGEIVELADAAGTGDVDDDRHAVRIDPGEEAEEVVDDSLRLRIPVESTDGAVLTVPLAAVSAGADGSSRVEVLDDPDEAGEASPATRLVTVEPGLATEGMVEITPADADVTADDLVVVGRDVDDETDDG